MVRLNMAVLIGGHHLMAWFACRNLQFCASSRRLPLAKQRECNNDGLPADLFAEKWQRLQVDLVPRIFVSSRNDAV